MLRNFENKECKVGNKFTFSKNTTNNSTLSLHISAYENSVDATALDSHDDKNDKTSNKKEMIKNWRNEKQLFIESLWTIQNPFEFPRQQSDKVSKPEVSHFRASQHLYNPNGTHSTTTTTTTTNEQNVDSSSASNQISSEENVDLSSASNQISSEENVSESRSHIDTIDTENPFYRGKDLHDKFVAILQVAESMAEENNFNESTFKTVLNEKCKRAGIEGKHIWKSWKQHISNVKKRYDERNGKFGNAEDRRFAIIQRKIDPDYCIHQSADVEKGDSNNGTEQQSRQQVRQVKRRRVSYGAANGQNFSKIVPLNYFRPPSTFRPVFDSNSPQRFSRSIDPVVNDGPQFRRHHLTSSNERRSESVSMNQSNVVKTETIEQRTSEPIVIDIDITPPPSPHNQNGDDFDDIASVHHPSPRPLISSMASATVSQSSSAQNALMFQQQPTIGDETAQQQIILPAPVGQGDNQAPAGGQLQQQQIHQGTLQEQQEVDNLSMLAAEVERLKKENEYKEQALRERLKSKVIDMMAEGLYP
uniref:Uncharacterized protein n=1 Tax=Panagrolaimus sp. PS1159 TaxID=55785 RepID=A0AC35EVH9_9BILA